MRQWSQPFKSTGYSLSGTRSTTVTGDSCLGAVCLLICLCAGQVLRQKLRIELASGQASIAQDKADLMEGTKTSLAAMQLKLKREAELKERIAAFAVFTKNAEKAKKLSRNLQASKGYRFGTVRVDVVCDSRRRVRGMNCAW